MKLLIALLPLALLLPAVGATTGTVHVTLSLTAGYHGLPSYKSCGLDVPEGANAGDVLDAATAAGCISGWSYDHYGTSRFVTGIDGIDAQTGTFWALYVNEALPDGGNAGIDDTHAAEGDNVEFVYADYFTPFTLP